jgi:hypothetical protein
LASNADQLVAQQAIGRFENIPRIPWSGLPADMISKMVNQGCRFTLGRCFVQAAVTRLLKERQMKQGG